MSPDASGPEEGRAWKCRTSAEEGGGRDWFRAAWAGVSCNAAVLLSEEAILRRIEHVSHHSAQRI